MENARGQRKKYSAGRDDSDSQWLGGCDVFVIVICVLHKS